MSLLKQEIMRLVVLVCGLALVASIARGKQYFHLNNLMLLRFILISQLDRCIYLYIFSCIRCDIYILWLSKHWKAKDHHHTLETIAAGNQYSKSTTKH